MLAGSTRMCINRQRLISLICLIDSQQESPARYGRCCYGINVSTVFFHGKIVSSRIFPDYTAFSVFLKPFISLCTKSGCF